MKYSGEAFCVELHSPYVIISTDEHALYDAGGFLSTLRETGDEDVETMREPQRFMEGVEHIQADIEGDLLMLTIIGSAYVDGELVPYKSLITYRGTFSIQWIVPGYQGRA